MGNEPRLSRSEIGEIRGAFSHALDEYESLLRALRREPVSFVEDDNRLKWITALLGYGVYGHALAIRCLFDGSVGRQIPDHVRAQFEASVKLAYVEHFPEAARDFLDIEPFERWFLASERTTLRAELRQAVDRDCLEVIARRPDLVADAPDRARILSGQSAPNHRAIYRRLQLPKISAVIDRLNARDPKWTRDLYGVIFRLGSLGTHSSILHLRAAFVEDATGFAFDVSQDWDGAADYLLQSTNYLLGFIFKVATRFNRFDDALQDRTKAIFDRHRQLAIRLGAIPDELTPL